MPFDNLRAIRCANLTIVENSTMLHGVVYLHGSLDLTVQMTAPFDGRCKSVHIPAIARKWYPSGYEGELAEPENF